MDHITLYQGTFNSTDRALSAISPFYPAFAHPKKDITAAAPKTTYPPLDMPHFCTSMMVLLDSDMYETIGHRVTPKPSILIEDFGHVHSHRSSSDSLIRTIVKPPVRTILLGGKYINAGRVETQVFLARSTSSERQK